MKISVRGGIPNDVAKDHSGHQANTRKLRRAKWKQQRRNVIIKCCGVHSCLNPPDKITKYRKNKNTTQTASEPGPNAPTEARFVDISEEPLATSTSLPDQTTIGNDQTLENTVETASAIDAINEATAPIIADESTSTSTIESTSTSTTTSTTTTTTTSTTTSTAATTAISTTEAPPTFFCNCPTQCDLSESTKRGLLTNPESFGGWRSLGKYSYLLGNEAVLWEKIWPKCCALGMKPISFESVQKLESVGEFFKDRTFNTKFWTSGTFTECNGTALSPSLIWCSIPSNNFVKEMWHPNGNQTDSAATCVSATAEEGKFLLRREACAKRFAYACEAVMENPGLLLENGCPSQQSCVKNSTMFAGIHLVREPSLVKGTFLESCGRIFYFSRLKKSWSDARSYCCSIGMDLASFPLAVKSDCFASLYQTFPSRLNGRYWTSGRSTKIPGKLYWCSEESYIYPREVVWEDGFPKIEHGCVSTAMNRSSGKLELRTGDCEEEQQFMCSAYHNYNTRAVQIWWDCLKSFGLKTDDEDALLNVFGPPPTSTLLCYGRCMGQKYQKILDNTVNTQSVLRYLEDQIKDEKVLQDAYKLVEQCIYFNETRLCEFTYLVLKCIMTNAYQLVQSLMANAIGDPVMIPPPILCLPNYQFCNETFNCVLNNSLASQLTASGKSNRHFLNRIPFF
ncbi:Hypothetical predicted protein [Cloeon dipterum]|uniref:C-type lectin domain-containing protein n=1 Tax=Cloeon dipterum TaxID=197152 RepID=A0A8S1E7Y5_9INSE|nr:Hypothetical predicted protein [Cloeon dipterum]